MIDLPKESIYICSMAIKRISTSEAGVEKGCTRQAIAEAIHAGKLDAERIGRTHAVLTNKKYRNWHPSPNMQKGGKARAKKAKRSK